MKVSRASKKLPGTATQRPGSPQERPGLFRSAWECPCAHRRRYWRGRVGYHTIGGGGGGDEPRTSIVYYVGTFLSDQLPYDVAAHKAIVATHSKTFNQLRTCSGERSGKVEKETTHIH